MKIILDIDPHQVDWAADSYVRIHRETAEIWGAPDSWDEYEWEVKGKFYGEPIEFYDEDDEWEAVRYLMEEKI